MYVCIINSEQYSEPKRTLENPDHLMDTPFLWSRCLQVFVKADPSKGYYLVRFYMDGMWKQVRTVRFIE